MSGMRLCLAKGLRWGNKYGFAAFARMIQRRKNINIMCLSSARNLLPALKVRCR